MCKLHITCFIVESNWMHDQQITLTLIMVISAMNLNKQTQNIKYSNNVFCNKFYNKWSHFKAFSISSSVDVHFNTFSVVSANCFCYYHYRFFSKHTLLLSAKMCTRHTISSVCYQKKIDSTINVAVMSTSNKSYHFAWQLFKMMGLTVLY